MGTTTTFVAKQQAAQDIGTSPVFAQNLIDFSATACGSAEVVQALKIPAGALVTDVWVIVKTAEGGTATATVGDGDSANGWDASTNLNATAGTVTSSLKGTDAFAVGKYYATADTIDLTLNNACDAAKVIVCARYSMIER